MGNMFRVVVLCNIWVALAASFALSIYALYFASDVSSKSSPREFADLVPGDKVDNIFWFVQVCNYLA